jgi:hypothetical protein
VKEGVIMVVGKYQDKVMVVRRMRWRSWWTSRSIRQAAGPY